MFARTSGVITRRPAILVAVIALVWAAVQTWPLVFHLGESMYGYPGDGSGTIAYFWWWDYALHHGKPLLYNSFVGVPVGSGWESAYFDVLQVAIFAPLSYAVGPIAAYNLGVLSSYPLTAWATYLLGRRLGMSALAGAFAGLAFAFVPYHQEKAMVHLMHTHMELFPAFLYFAVGWRQSGSRWQAVAAGAILGVALWTDPTMTYLIALLAVVFFATSMILRPGDRPWRKHLQSHVLAGALMSVVGALFIPGVLLISTRPGAHAATLADQFQATERAVTELGTYSARLREFFQPWHLNPLLPHSLQAFEKANLHGSSFAEQTLTIGFTLIFLATIGAIAMRRHFAVILCVAIGLAGFVMTQPPERTIAGITIPAPSHFLFQVLPIFRVYSRFAMLVLLAAALLAGFGFMYLQSRLGSSARFVLPLLVVLVAIEFDGVPPSQVLQILPAPAEYTWLRTQPAGTLIEYPLAIKPKDAETGTRIEVTNRVYSMYQLVHEHPMFNGAASSSAAYQLSFDLEPYYAPGVSDRLLSLHITYVFVHRDAYRSFGRDPSQPLPGYRHVELLDDTDIYIADAR